MCTYIIFCNVKKILQNRCSVSHIDNNCYAELKYKLGTEVLLES